MPAAEAYVPATHAVQVPPVPAFPAAQSVQLEKGEAEVEPSAQVDAAEAPAPEYCPTVAIAVSRPIGDSL